MAPFDGRGDSLAREIFVRSSWRTITSETMPQQIFRRTAEPYSLMIFSFIETRLFSKLVFEYLSDEEYGSLQQALIKDPDAGQVTMYAKNVAENIPAIVPRRIRQEADDG